MNFLNTQNTAERAYNSLIGAAVLGDTAPGATIRTLQDACRLSADERHKFFLMITSTELRAQFLGIFENFLVSFLTADNIDKRHFGAYVELCSAAGHEQFGKAKSFVERAYTSVGRKLPFWMKKKFDDINVVYFSAAKQGHHGPKARQLAKKAARSAHDAAIRSSMKGGSGGGKQQPNSGKKNKKK